MSHADSADSAAAARRIAVLQHHPDEGPGRILRWAAARGHRVTVHFAERGELPARDATGAGIDALVVLGGPQSVNAPPPWLRAEMDFVGAALAAGIPVYGACLGAQMLCLALGGRVTRLPVPEKGWTTVGFDDGRSMDVLEWHNEQCELPPGMAPIARSEACAVQAFRAGPGLLGLQFHAEWDAAAVATINAAFGDASPLPRTDDPVRQQRIEDWLFAMLDDWIAAAPAGKAAAGTTPAAAPGATPATAAGVTFATAAGVTPAAAAGGKA